MEKPHVIGLDISLTGTGIADSTGQRHKVGRDGLLKLPLHDRADAIAALRDDICTVIWTPRPHLVVMESCASAQAYGGAAERAGLWWMVVGVLRGYGIPVVEVPPSLLKKYATGKGNATKADMRMALYQRMGIDERDDNKVDAAWLRAMGADHLGHPLASLSKTHRDALAKVTWPEVTR